MEMERSCKGLLITIASIILLIIFGSLLWFHRTDEAPKAPLHSRIVRPGRLSAKARPSVLIFRRTEARRSHLTA